MLNETKEQIIERLERTCTAYQKEIKRLNKIIVDIEAIVKQDKAWRRENNRLIMG